MADEIKPGVTTSEHSTMKIAIMVITMVTTIGGAVMSQLDPSGIAYAVVAGIVAIAGVAMKYIGAREKVKVADSAAKALGAETDGGK